MFSDTDWWTPNGQLPGRPANWIISPGVTGAEFYFGFVHVQDPLILYAEEIPTWNAYGLAPFGGPLLVESNTAPYLGSHMLTTDLPPQPNSAGPELSWRDRFRFGDAAQSGRHSRLSTRLAIHDDRPRNCRACRSRC